MWNLLTLRNRQRSRLNQQELLRNPLTLRNLLPNQPVDLQDSVVKPAHLKKPAEGPVQLQEPVEELSKEPAGNIMTSKAYFGTF